MKVYVVVGVVAGVIDCVRGFGLREQAEKEEKKLREEYGIQEGMEGESENTVEMQEVEIEV